MFPTINLCLSIIVLFAFNINYTFSDKKSYLSIKLTVEGGSVELISVQILDINHNIIEEIPLDLVNVKDNFYVTTKTFVPPNDFFKIGVCT